MKADFDSINAAAKPSLLAILRRLLPGGKVQSGEYIARNPTRSDKHPGSFKINLRTGRWSDFATGDRGGDIISLVGYLQGCKQGAAAKLVEQMLGMNTEARHGR
jgi:hypothetical protein